MAGPFQVSHNPLPHKATENEPVIGDSDLNF